MSAGGTTPASWRHQHRSSWGGNTVLQRAVSGSVRRLVWEQSWSLLHSLWRPDRPEPMISASTARFTLMIWWLVVSTSASLRCNVVAVSRSTSGRIRIRVTSFGSVTGSNCSSGPRRTATWRSCRSTRTDRRSASSPAAGMMGGCGPVACRLYRAAGTTTISGSPVQQVTSTSSPSRRSTRSRRTSRDGSCPAARAVGTIVTTGTVRPISTTLAGVSAIRFRKSTDSPSASFPIRTVGTRIRRHGSGSTWGVALPCGGSATIAAVGSITVTTVDMDTSRSTSASVAGSSTSTVLDRGHAIVTSCAERRSRGCGTGPSTNQSGVGGIPAMSVLWDVTKAWKT